jgi:hypothetical protein
MEKKDLQKLLSQPYNQDNWKKIVQFVFPNVSILSSPKEFPINNEKIKKFRQIGSVKLNDGKNLALFELLLADNVDIRRNRVELNKAISSDIDQEAYHGVLSVFEQGTDDYRFTFSAKSTEFDEEESDFVQKKTDSKRYTYILGKNESCKTPADRFYKLSENKSEVDINSIQNAFSVEQLSKEFFDKYKKQFEKFWKYIASKDEYKGVFINGQGEREVKIRNFTKKLLGRIVFLHFLQKKGWMGCPEHELWGAGDKKFMQNLFKNFTHKEQFHSKCLVELFYNTLNAKRDDQLFSCEGLEGALNKSKVPYLNGGLFDSDKIESKKIDFPESYFEDLFDFFGQYNFTIDENDPNDHEVGIDPEMLGHIFENLLEDNKDKGAFYTPKVIVQYMCQESLIEYLSTKLEAETSGEVKQAIEDLIRNRLAEDISDLDLVEPIAQALFDVKICDPAIGSGAFPMGILNVIYQVIETLYYLERDSVAKVWNISYTKWQPHLVKKNIIQHSIYGVDIESGAVDIARLRFWLALVVDEVEPLPLPNLDYKIMQGNSLLESFEGIDLSEIGDAAAYENIQDDKKQVDLFTGEVKSSTKVSSLEYEDVKTLMDEYFNANDPETKKNLHKRIDDQVLNHIHFTLSKHKKDLQKKANKLNKKVGLDEAAARTWEQKEKIRTSSKTAKALVKLKTALSQHKDKELKLAQLSNSNERPFFLWHLFFQEVFEQGGFDIVIGNPPYVRQERLGQELKQDLKKRFPLVANGTADLYVYFYSLGLGLLKKDAVLIYITLNKYLKTKYGLELRNLLASEHDVDLIIDFFELPVFEASTDTSITKVVNSKNKLKTKYFPVHTIDKLNLFKITSGNYLKVIKDKTEWKFIEMSEEGILKKLYNDTNSLKIFTDDNVHYGIKTGANKIFIINDKLKKEIVSQDSNSNNIIHKYLEPRKISKWNVENSQKFIIGTFPSLKLKIDDFPGVRDYLSQFRNQLEPKPRGFEWYETQDNIKYWELFLKPKIIYIHTAKNHKFYIDKDNYFVNNSCYLISDGSCFLFSFLNSKLFEWFKKIKFVAYGDAANSGRVKLDYNKMINVPIKNIDKKTENVFKKLVLEGKNSSEQSRNEIDEKLDNFIYKLYDLLYEEVLIIEPAFTERMNKQEYDTLIIE